MKKGLTKFVKDSKYSLSGFMRYGIYSQYKHVLVVGGSNAFGNSLVSAFADTWKVANIDYKTNDKAHFNLVLDKEKLCTEEYITELESNIESFSNRFESIICVSEGYTQGSIKDSSIFSQYWQLQQEQVIPSLIASHIAWKLLAPNGLLLLTGGAIPFKQTCPNALAYGATKNNVHSLGLNLGEKEDISNDVTIVTILPDIKKAGSDQANPDIHTHKPQDYEKITQMVKMWSDGKKRPMNGTFMHLKNINNSIVPEYL